MSGPTTRRIAGAAALIAGLTVAARLVGLARNLVFIWAVGYTDLGTVYQTANTVPNIIFEIVASGALASLVVPLLAGLIARDDRAGVGRTASALLTWTVALLVPFAGLVALFAHPLVALISHQASPDAVAVGTRMLRVFTIQLPLYGIGVVLAGVLQAYRRFTWPALAPLLSSLTVIGAYLLFPVVDQRAAPVDQVSRAGELVLSVGTTLGVAVLALCQLPAVYRLRVRLRPTFALPRAARDRAGGLALAGAVTAASPAVALLLVIYLANPPAPEGTLNVFTVAQTMYLLPWAVLAVPVATSAYQALADAHARGDEDRYARTLAGSTRAVLLLSLLGAAVLVAVAEPAAHLLGGLSARNPSVGALATGIVGLAPGLIGYGLFALLSRALYARGAARAAAGVTVLGWGGVLAATAVLAALLPLDRRIAALTWGNTVGMVLLAGLLLAAVRRTAGPPALAGTGRSTAVGALAAVLAGAAGWEVARLAGPTPGTWELVGFGMLSAAVVLVVFAVVLLIGDRRDAAALLGRLRRRPARPAASPGPRPGGEGVTG